MAIANYKKDCHTSFFDIWCALHHSHSKFLSRRAERCLELLRPLHAPPTQVVQEEMTQL